MEVTITIPQNIIDVLTERGWDEQEVLVLIKSYIEESPLGFENDFFDWVEDQDEEPLEDLFREAQQLEVGMKVKIVNPGTSHNPKGAIGKITWIDPDGDIRVVVKGYTDDNLANWHSVEDVKLIK